MAHKVHPKVYRIGTTQDWDSVWFSKKNYKKFLQEDLKIREFLEKKFEKGIIERVKIERVGHTVTVKIRTARPGLLIGRGGEGAEKLSKEIAKIVKGKEIKVDIEEVKEPGISASLLAQQIAAEIERRVPFRRAVKRAIERIKRTGKAKGYKIVVKGRLDGAEIARKETFFEGQLPRQTIRADIDYGEARAHCSYGVVGVKVWIYKGEKI